MKTLRHFLLTFPVLLATAAQAGDFDGSRPLICAPVVVHDCPRGDECEAGLPEDFDAPAFMRFDFKNKKVIGAKITSEILLLERSEAQLLLQGREGGHGWSIVIGTRSGDMTVTLASHNRAVVMYGSCTPLN